MGKGKTVVLIDCGTKRNIIRELESRGVKILIVPWDMDFKKIKLNTTAWWFRTDPGIRKWPAPP